MRKQERVEGEQKGKIVSDFPPAALGQVLKDFNFPAGRGALVSFVEQSNRPERNEVLPLVQKLQERHYRNVSEVAEAARLVQS